MMSPKFSKPVYGDTDAIYMSCPEAVGKHIAQKLSGYMSCVEICSAVGLLAVQLAKTIPKVTTIEVDPGCVAAAKRNARLYGVEGRIRILTGDGLDEKLLRSIKAEVAVLDPDWSAVGSDKHNHVASFSLTQPNAEQLFKLVASTMTTDIIMRVPDGWSMAMLSQLGICDVERIIWGGKPRLKVVYWLSGAVGRETEVSFD
jgi:hypothetical protein